MRPEHFAAESGDMWDMDAKPRAFKQLDVSVSQVGKIRKGRTVTFRFKGDRPERDPHTGVVNEMYRRSVFGSRLLTHMFGEPVAIVGKRPVSVRRMEDVAVDP